MNNDENIPKQKIIYETVYNLLLPSDDKILSEAILELCSLLLWNLNSKYIDSY